MTPWEYWRSGAGLLHVTPGGKAWPEGDGFGAMLSAVVGNGRVLEIGCGPGRLSPLFAPEGYVGVDICAEAIDRARIAAADHRFLTIADGAAYPPADVTLLHTVLLHIPDEELAAFIARLTTPRVVVSEILGRHWRRDGEPPVFNRKLVDYVEAFAPRWRLRREIRHRYPHYRDTDLTVMEFCLC